MMHKLAKEVKGIKVVHRNLPLDTDCNKYLQGPFHQGSCIDAKYAIAAEKQGKFWDMNDILFQYKPQTEQAILDLVKDKGFDMENFRKMQTVLKRPQKFEKKLTMLMQKV